ncbi:hypothetical protein [Amycolatopsis sp. GM8]|uniref:hypothetical protein n=1 Tax=Amycolatopsis sp. GM8 TaxID=2896530 RepID=UPI001F269EFD|nr:hypothetical protein [Amycolatopsis sp. GM8]
MRTCIQRRFDAIAWLRWLAKAGIKQLDELTQQHCDRWLQQRRDDGLVPRSRMGAILAVKDLARYTELFTTDHYPAGFMPWPGKTAAQVAELEQVGENATQPIPDDMLHYALRAAPYLVEVIGPHAAALAEDLAAHRKTPTSKHRPQPDAYADLMAVSSGKVSTFPEHSRTIVVPCSPIGSVVTASSRNGSYGSLVPGAALTRSPMIRSARTVACQLALCTQSLQLIAGYRSYFGAAAC